MQQQHIIKISILRVLLMLLFVSGAIDAYCQTSMPIGDLPYFGINRTVKRILRIEDGFFTYDFDEGHSVILSHPSPIKVDTKAYIFSNLPKWLSVFKEDDCPITVIDTEYDWDSLVSDDILFASAWGIRCYDRHNRVRFICGRYCCYDDAGRLYYTYREPEGSREMIVFEYDSQGDAEVRKLYLDDIGGPLELYSTTYYSDLEKDAYGNWISRTETVTYVQPEMNRYNKTQTVTRKIWYEDEILPPPPSVQNDDIQEEPDEEFLLVESMIKAIMSNDWAGLAEKIQFPIHIVRRYPLPTIVIEKEEFLSCAAEIFDDEFKQFLYDEPEQDWVGQWYLSKVFYGWIYNGLFNVEWLCPYPGSGNKDEELKAIMEKDRQGLPPSLQNAISVCYRGYSEKHILYVLQERDNNYCLAIWNKDTPTTEEPITVIHNGTYDCVKGIGWLEFYSFSKDGCQWDLEDYEDMSDYKVLTVKDKRGRTIREESFSSQPVGR